MKDILYSWVFRYNPFTEEYLGVEREFYTELWSGGQHLVTAKSFEELEQKIINGKTI